MTNTGGTIEYRSAFAVVLSHQCVINLTITNSDIAKHSIYFFSSSSWLTICTNLIIMYFTIFRSIVSPKYVMKGLTF